MFKKAVKAYFYYKKIVYKFWQNYRSYNNSPSSLPSVLNINEIKKSQKIFQSNLIENQKTLNSINTSHCSHYSNMDQKKDLKFVPLQPNRKSNQMSEDEIAIGLSIDIQNLICIDFYFNL